MINNLILMNGYGVFVWSSFVITFLVCGIFYYKTRKTLKKYEKEFAKEIENNIKENISNDIEEIKPDNNKNNISNSSEEDIFGDEQTFPFVAGLGKNAAH